MYRVVYVIFFWKKVTLFIFGKHIQRVHLFEKMVLRFFYSLGKPENTPPLSHSLLHLYMYSVDVLQKIPSVDEG